MIFVGTLLEKNNATFRCYGNISHAKYSGVPTPSKIFSNIFVVFNKKFRVANRVAKGKLSFGAVRVLAVPDS